MQHIAIAACLFLTLFSLPSPAAAENLILSKIASGATAPTATAPRTDEQRVYAVLVKMLDRWNARDIDGLMSVYWNSPSLLAVIDAEQFDGWESLYRSYKIQSRNPNSMGTINPTRVQVKLLQPDLAFGVISWTMRYPENTHALEIVGTTTMDLQKFGPEWKIVVVHTSFTEL